MLIDSENDNETGVNLVSFVSYPAIERDFVALSEPEKQFHTLNHDKQIVTGPALIPNQQILRISEDGTPYFIKFSRETIEKIRDKYHRLKKTDLTNDEHETPLAGNFLVESWIIEEPTKDKAAALGLSGLPAGTWVLSFKVPDTNYWAEAIKSGIRAGFSIEGVFNTDLIETEIKQNKMTVAEKFYNVVKEFFSKNENPAQALAEETPATETTEDAPTELGANFSAWLLARIEAMVSEEMTAEMVDAELATATGLSVEEIATMKEGPQVCPPVDSVANFAAFFAVEMSDVVAALVADGCDVPQAEESEPEMADENAEPATDWADLEKAIADVKAMEATHAATITAKDAEITELKKTVEAQKTQIQTLSAEPAAVAVDMSKTTPPAKQTQSERMADAWARIKAQKNGN